MTLLIDIADPRWNDLGDIAGLAQAAWAATLSDDAREASALFTNDTDIRALNKQWRGMDQPTNVLSFPAAPAPSGPQALGDIVLAYETVAREAAETRKLPLHHASHLVVHGLLHLLGHDHEKDGEALLMEATERAILAKLGITDPYAP